MKTFFKNFPKVPIRVNDKIINYDDYFRFVDVNELYLNSFNNYDLYEIEDGERPDIVSQKLYETTDFYWTFFIANDHLKGGLKSWPLSNSQLNKSILDSYGKFSVCEIMPKILSFNIDMMTTSFKYDLLFGDLNIDLMDIFAGIPDLFTLLHGLDVQHPWLRVYRLDSTNSHKLGKIEKYDTSRWQLWIKDVEDFGFFETNLNTNQIGFKLINPYPQNSEKYNEVEEQNKNWLLKTALEWYPLYFGFYQGNLSDIQNLQNDVESKLIFDVRTFYPMSENAPDYYFNLNTDEVLSNLEAQITQQGIPKTFREVEEEINESKRRIKVLNKNVIYNFVNKYNEILNKTPRLNFES